MLLFLGMKILLLLQEDEDSNSSEGNSQNDKTLQKTWDAVHDDETKDCSTYSTCCPGDIASLYAHELQRLL